MIVHRLLDALFRTLDTLDAARENIDRALGRDGDGKPVDAAAHDVTAPAAPKARAPLKRARAATTTTTPAKAPVKATPAKAKASAKPAPAKKASSARVESKGPPRKGGDDDATASRKAAAKQKPPAKAKHAPDKAAEKKRASMTTTASSKHEKHPTVEKAASEKTIPRSVSKNLKKTVGKKFATQTAAKTAGKQKPVSSSRKGSIDRSGKDFDSARARAVYVALKSKSGQVIQDDATLDGKKVLARVVWALFAAENAGSEMGLTAADASALLHLAGGMAVFSTNIARTCRDEVELIEESEPDGRIKRYKLTARGREKAREIATETIG